MVAELASLNITSRIHEPLMRTFLQNSISASIYQKAKSNGNIYRPGFTIEDRQYTITLKQLTIASRNSSSSSVHKVSDPILENLDMRAVVGLPIQIGKKLINGYVCEVAILDQQTRFYFNNQCMNLILCIVRENSILATVFEDTRTFFDHTAQNSTLNFNAHQYEFDSNRLLQTPHKKSPPRQKKQSLGKFILYLNRIDLINSHYSLTKH